METTAHIAGYEGYHVTRTGEVYNNGKPKAPICRPGAAIKIRLQKDGRRRGVGLAKLVASAFVPNPENHKRIVFLDGNNRNCSAGNIAWASEKEFSRYTLFPGKPLETEKPKKEKKNTIRTEKKNNKKGSKKIISECPSDPSCMPIPSHPGYYVSPLGDVYSKGKKLAPQRRGGGAARLRIKHVKGMSKRYAVAWLVAAAFVPNPGNLPRLVFLDRDRGNHGAANLKWMTQEEHDNHYFNTDLLGQVKKKKTVLVERDTGAVPVSGHEGYFISPKGIVYRGNRVLVATSGRKEAPQVRLQVPGAATRTYRNLGLATLVAEHFLRNPRRHRHIIFRDRDNRNCSAENIAWVDGETFLFYSGVLQKTGSRKIVLERGDALRRCTDQMLREYYATLDEDWLELRWKEVDKNLARIHQWEQFKSDCYMYYMDRAKRFSLLMKPEGLLVSYIKGLRSKLRKEVSDELPIHLLLRTDESLRDTGRYKMYEEW